MRTLIKVTGNKLNYDTWQKKKKEKREKNTQIHIYKIAIIYIYVYFPHSGPFPWTTPMDKGQLMV